MPIEVWFSFAALALTFLITPGVSHLLMLSNSLAYGPKRASATALGDLSANVLQMLAAGLGMAAVIAAAPTAFTVVKWAGVLYLVYLGVKMMRSRGYSSKTANPDASLRALYAQGFFTSASNPKAVMFFAALFPQFISADLPFWPQQGALMATYLFFDGAFLAAYGLAAGALKSRLTGRGFQIINVVSGAVIIIGAILLVAKTV